MRAQAVRKLLRQHDQGCAVAAPRNMQAAADYRQRHVVCRNKLSADLVRQDALAGEIEMRGGESGDYFRCRSSRHHLRRAEIANIDVGNFVDDPEPLPLPWRPTRKARERQTPRTWDTDRLIAANIAHPESLQCTKQHCKGYTAAVDPRTKPIQIKSKIPLQ